MRFTKFSIVLAYVMAALAIAFYAAAWLSMGDPQHATWLVAQGCFLLLLSIWANVCS